MDGCNSYFLIFRFSALRSCMVFGCIITGVNFVYWSYFMCLDLIIFGHLLFSIPWCHWTAIFARKDYYLLFVPVPVSLIQFFLFEVFFFLIWVFQVLKVLFDYWEVAGWTIQFILKEISELQQLKLLYSNSEAMVSSFERLLIGYYCKHLQDLHYVLLRCSCDSLSICFSRQIYFVNSSLYLNLHNYPNFKSFSKCFHRISKEHFSNLEHIP